MFLYGTNIMHQQHHPLLTQTLGTQREIVSFHYGSAQNSRKVYIQSSLHADELPGMLVSFCLKRKLAALEEQGAISGEIVLVPVANPIGLNQHLLAGHLGRFEFDSSENFNRNYPNLIPQLCAQLDGKLTDSQEQNTAIIKAVIRDQLDALQVSTQLESQRLEVMKLAADADIVLDLHCDWEAVLHIYTADPLWPDVEPLARYLGAGTALLAMESGGNPFDEACSQIWYLLADHFAGRYPIARNGCIAVTVELRGQTDVSYELAEQDADAILAYLTQQGHITQPAVHQPALVAPASPLAGVEPLKTPVSGVIVHRCPVGTVLHRGDPVADIIDPLTDRVTTLQASIDGVLFARPSQRFATAGDTIAKIAGQTAFRSGNLLSA